MSVLNMPISLEIHISSTVVPHNYVGCSPTPPGPPPMLPGLAAEIPSPHFMIAGFLTGKNKITRTVVYMGSLRIVQAEHDTGFLCPHVQSLCAPDNQLTPLHILFSSRKAMYSASTVKQNGIATACLGGVVPLPFSMLACGDPISIPFMPYWDSIPNFLVDCTVGMTTLDIAMGLIAGRVTMLIDGIFAIFGPASAPAKAAAQAPAYLVEEVFKKAFGGLALSGVLRNAMKNALSDIPLYLTRLAHWYDRGMEGPAPLPNVNLWAGPARHGFNYDAEHGEPQVSVLGFRLEGADVTHPALEHPEEMLPRGPVRDFLFGDPL